MENRVDYKNILDGLVTQISKYNAVLRNNTQPFILKRLQTKFPTSVFDFNDEMIRESLLEHVGCLPIIACFLHPYLDKKVDLGRVLIMLTVHDIGEIETGDEMTFTKKLELIS